MRYVIALIASFAVTGCIAPPDWYKDGATVQEFERDRAQCVYEANAATAGYSQGQTARTQSGAIAQGFGEGLTMALRQRELAILCMRAKGYIDVPAGTARPAPVVARPPEKLTPEPVTIYRTEGVNYGDPESLKPPSVGAMSFEVERIARDEKCHDSPQARLVASGPGFETYSVVCSGSDALSLRCELTNCKVLK